MRYISHYTSPLGSITIASDGESVIGLWFDGQKYDRETLGPDFSIDHDQAIDDAVRWLDIYFEGRDPGFLPPLKVDGSDFRKMVLDILLSIPYGSTMTYGAISKEIARRTGKAHVSAQAVGGAVGHNPISLIIPCHRVVGYDGSLTGYAGGLDKKQYLLSLEQQIVRYDLVDSVEAFSTRRNAALPYPILLPKQTHSINVAIVERIDTPAEELDGVDALVTNLRGLAIGIRTADCIPVLLYDPVRKAIGAIHSGWRGTVGKISAQVVLAMAERFGTDPADLKAVIGPGIALDSFQVGEEVALQFKNAGFPMERIWSFRGPMVEGSMDGGHHINLREACRITLTECGVKAENINVSEIDTYKDLSFFSARRESINCGRIITAIMLK